MEDSHWTQHGALIRRLYVTERKSLVQVKRIMEEEHGFPPTTLSTWETTLRDRLGVFKKLKKEQWRMLYEDFTNRGDRPFDVYAGENLVYPWAKAWKELRRNRKLALRHGIPRPAELRLLTPPPQPADIPPTSMPPQTGPTHPRGRHVTQNHLTIVATHHDTPARQSTSLSLNQHATNDLWRCLIRVQTEDMPWNIFRRGFLASIIGPENVYDQREDCGLLTYALIPPDEFLSHFNGQPMARICESRFPGPDHIEEHLSSFTALSTKFNAYHILNTLVYLASNDLISYYDDDESQIWKQLLDMLVYRIPPEVVRTVFSANYLSIRTTWENTFRRADYEDHSDAVVFLVEMMIDTHPDWVDGMMNTIFFAAARFGNARLVGRLIQKGARPFYARSLDFGRRRGTEMTAAAERGAWDCVKLMLDPGVCDPNASVLVKPGLLGYNPRGAVSNFHFFFGSVERQLSAAWKFDPEDGMYFWSEHVWTEEMGSIMEGLDLFLQAGADVDLPYFCTSGYWGDDSPLHAFHERSNTELGWYPTILDVSLGLDDRLFHYLEPYSRAHFATNRVTRSGVCKAALEGHHVLSDYLHSRPLPPAGFLQLILAEQFFMVLSKQAGRIIKVNARLSRSLIESGVDLGPAAMEQCGGATALLESLVASASAFGLDDDTLFILECLLQKGAGISPEVLALGVQRTGVRLLETLAQYGAGIEKYGRYALMVAARQDNYEAVDWLLQQRVNIKSEIGDPPFTLIGAARRRGFRLRLDDWSLIGLEMTQYLLDKGSDMKLHPSDASPCKFIMDVDIDHVNALISQNPSEMAKMSDLDWLSLCSRLLIRCTPDNQLQVLEILKSQHRIFDPGALLAAAIQGQASHDLIEELLKTASSIELYSCQYPKLTPLQAAASNCDQSLVLRLLDRGANIHAPAHEDGGETVLTALFGNYSVSAEEIRQRNDLLPFLIAKGEGLAVVNPPGWGPLHNCAMQGDLNSALLLLEHGADPTVIGIDEALETGTYLDFSTALDVAVNYKRLDISHVLLKAGGLSARPGTTGYEGALMRAEERHCPAIAQVIRDHMVARTEELHSRPELLRQHEERIKQQVYRLAEAERQWEQRVR